MATAYRIIVREVLRRVNGIAGAVASTVETNYGTAPLTTTQADSPVYNLSFIQDVVVDTHGRLALEIASAMDPITGIGCHPWRAFFRDVTANVAHGGNLPTTGTTASKTIIGAFGRPYDSSNTDLFLTPAGIERVSAYNQYTGIYTNNPYLYHVNGGKVYHTVTNIVFDCCVYERSDQVSAVAAGNITLPDALVDALVFGSVANIIIEDEYANQAGIYAGYYLACIQAIQRGSVSMPGLPMAAMMGAQAA